MQAKYTYPTNIEARWKQAEENNRLVEWRSLAFLLSAEAKMAQIYCQYAVERDLIAKMEEAFKHVYALTPKRIEETA
jgi:predicted transcriptional regulator